jgi:hypothetical protein
MITLQWRGFDESSQPLADLPMLDGALCNPACLSAILIGRTIHHQEGPTMGWIAMCWNLPQDRKA